MGEVGVYDVHKQFGRTEVLKGVSVEIADGEMMVILGPSGCGKSTLLRLIAGLETVSSGEIRIAGRRVNDLEPKDRDIAMVFQNYALYPHMTVFDNMAYGLRNLRTPKDQIEVRVRDAARILGLDALLDRRPRQLSGGQRQRVAMGRAIVREPAVFLFDEPLSNLDAKLRVTMRHELKQLQDRLRTTGIYVTHDQVEAMTLGHRLMVLDAGRVEQVGAPLDLYARPASTFVAGFIGSPAMNFIPGKLAGDGASVAVDNLSLPIDPPLPAMARGEVTVGLRPEHVELVLAAEANVPLRVEWLEALGADTVAHGRLPGGAAMVARIAGTQTPRTGDLLPLRAQAHHVHVFDPVSGRRVGPQQGQTGGMEKAGRAA